MGKKRRILANPGKFGKKHSAHPRMNLTTTGTGTETKVVDAEPNTLDISSGIVVKEIDITPQETKSVKTTTKNPSFEQEESTPTLKTTKKTTTRRRKTTKKKTNTTTT